MNEYKNYRHGAENMEHDGLTCVDYSTISKKATNLDYKICKKHFDILISKCNRSLKRILKLPKDLLAIDSTAITIGQGRLKLAKFKEEKSAIKLHVAFNVNTLMP